MLDYTKEKKTNPSKIPFFVKWVRFLISFLISNYIKIGIGILIYMVFFEPKIVSTIMSEWINNFIVKTIKDIRW